jgi:alkylhydroperoxidase family enzyme
MSAVSHLGVPHPFTSHRYNHSRTPPAARHTRKRSALALTEAVTLIAGNEVADDVWEQAEDEFDPEEIGQIPFAIVTINAFNRLNVTVGTEAGHYVSGMFA